MCKATGSVKEGLSRREVLGGAVGLMGAGLLAGPQRVLAQSGDKIRFGISKPLTGRLATSYAPLYVGAYLGAKEVNEAGGILGRQVEIIEEDDEGSPAKEPAVMRKLLDRGAQFVLGPVGSSQTISALSVTTPAKVIHAGGIGAEEGADGVRFPYHYQFNLNANHQRDVWAGYAIDSLKGRKIGLITENSAYGESHARAMLAGMKKRGAVPVIAEVFRSDATDLKPYVQNLQRAGVDVVFFANAPAGSALAFYNALQSLNWNPPVIGGNGMFYEVILDTVPAEYLKNAYAPFFRTLTFTDTEQPGERQIEFVRKLTTYPDTKLAPVLALESYWYDFFHLIKKVAEAEKTLDSDRLKRALDNLRGYPGVMGNLSFTVENHNAYALDALVMSSVLSARNPKSMGGFFRQRV